MTKNELKQLIKEVLAEQNALTTLQISTVDRGTTLLLYRGDARQTERLSDKAYKTPTQFRDLIASLNTTGGMTTDEVIKNILKKLTATQLKELIREKIVVSDRVSIDEDSIKEVQGYVFGPMETPNNWISTNAKPKMKNGVKNWVVSAADFQKAFPNIQMKQLPTNPSQYSDYYVVDNEGDLIAYSQSNIGSGIGDIGNAIIVGGLGGASAFFGILAVGAGWNYANKFAAEFVFDISNKIRAERAAAAAAARYTNVIHPIVEKFKDDMVLKQMYAELPKYDPKNYTERQKKLTTITKYIKSKLSGNELNYFTDVSKSLRDSNK